MVVVCTREDGWVEQDGAGNGGTGMLAWRSAGFHITGGGKIRRLKSLNWGHHFNLLTGTDDDAQLVI